MKRILISLCCLISLIASGKNPLDFPEYKQNIIITYSNPEKAETVKLEILPLPDGKKIAYTARWDDTMASNLKMAELLKKHGMKGTFMLHGTKFREQGRKLLEYGHAIGNHTEHHYWLPLLNPNQIFYEIALYQVQLETELQTSVVSHVFPFGAGSDLFKDFPGTCVKVFDAANLYVFPFYWIDPHQYFKRSRNAMLTTKLFASDDRNPTVSLYRQRMEKAKNEVNPELKRITHGIHVLMTPEGFKELDLAFAETARDPDFIFMTENDYGAYRYSAFHAAPVLKTKQNGTAVFELTRFQPGHLGSDIPLSLQIEPVPDKVEANGIPLQRGENGFWSLPHTPGKTMPAFYEWLKDSNEHSKQMPGLIFKLTPDKELKQFRIWLTNGTGKTLNNLILQLALPPKWTENKRTFILPSLKKDDSAEFLFDTPETTDDPDFSEGIYHFIARLDFDGGRIYRTISREGTDAGEGIHTMLRYLGPIPNAALTKELKKEFSLPGKLKPVDYQGTRYNWKQYRSTAFNRYSFDLRSREYQNRELRCPAVAEFIMPEDGEVRIAMYRGTELYCNGTLVGTSRRHYKVQAKKGRNRIYIPHAAVYESIVIYPPGKFVLPEE